jgi:hypothetical protein
VECKRSIALINLSGETPKTTPTFEAVYMHRHIYV